MSCYQPTGGNQPSRRTPLAPPPSRSPPSAGPSNTGVIMIAGQEIALGRIDAGATPAQQEWASMISLRCRTGRYGATSQASHRTSITEIFGCDIVPLFQVMGVSASALTHHRANDNDTPCPAPAQGVSAVRARRCLEGRSSVETCCRWPGRVGEVGDGRRDAAGDPDGSLADGPLRCAGPRSLVVPAIGPSPCPSADAMVGNGGTAVTVVACCLAWREQHVTGRRRKPAAGWPLDWSRDHRRRQYMFCGPHTRRWQQWQ